ncbi:SWIM zinc finger family protein [Lyngbya confervoides]|uniref:SWIM zinc finger family protein n=1 Tax=Lyngbya confervoides BDU141951 TaxID=1574623 RepID=A0ABD4T1L8_9CYAN|nr:SWIM zinc finger family protein [Lyngbya confervoides]MCM1982414.1 SWIM zinc finger family protein [Lyngbya confervoides BDU141951]
MAQKTKTWWGKTFVEALEGFCDPGRLSRGRSYSGSNRLKSFNIHEGEAIASVRGNVNPYFGVYKEPTYHTTVKLSPISAKNWSSIIEQIGSKASFVSKLMLNEIPENIEDCFKPVGVNFLPRSKKDCDWRCSCPDWGNPCKHVAGVFYRIAQELDQDPLLLFELRGISREALKQELKRSPLGQTLVDDLSEEDAAFPEAVDSYYTQPETQELPKDLSYQDFWQGHPSQNLLPNSKRSLVSALLVKKQGDYPAFWHKETSFIALMEEFYQRFRDKNQKFLE